jgi:hypothetical protein
LRIAASDALFGEAVVADPRLDLLGSAIQGVEVEEIGKVSQRVDQTRPQLPKKILNGSNVSEEKRFTQ